MQPGTRRSGTEVDEVYAACSNRGTEYMGIAVDVDESVLLLRLNDGTLATMQGSRCNGAGRDVRMELAGTDATYVVGLAERSPLQSAEQGFIFPSGKPWMTFRERFYSAYVAEMHAFIGMAVRRGESACTVAEALEALYIAEAADLSRREYQPVSIDRIRST